jgi:hypothetical protein
MLNLEELERQIGRTEDYLKKNQDISARRSISTRTEDEEPFSIKDSKSDGSLSISSSEKAPAVAEAVPSSFNASLSSNKVYADAKERDLLIQKLLSDYNVRKESRKLNYFDISDEPPSSGDIPSGSIMEQADAPSKKDDFPQTIRFSSKDTFHDSHHFTDVSSSAASSKKKNETQDTLSSLSLTKTPSRFVSEMLKENKNASSEEKGSPFSPDTLSPSSPAMKEEENPDDISALSSNHNFEETVFFASDLNNSFDIPSAQPPQTWSVRPSSSSRNKRNKNLEKSFRTAEVVINPKKSNEDDMNLMETQRILKPKMHAEKLTGFDDKPFSNKKKNDFHSLDNSYQATTADMKHEPIGTLKDHAKLPFSATRRAIPKFPEERSRWTEPVKETRSSSTERGRERTAVHKTTAAAMKKKKGSNSNNRDASASDGEKKIYPKRASSLDGTLREHLTTKERLAKEAEEEFKRNHPFKPHVYTKGRRRSSSVDRGIAGRKSVSPAPAADFLHRHSKDHFFNRLDEMSKEHQQKQRQKDKLRNEIESFELLQCTFQPEITKQSSRLLFKKEKERKVNLSYDDYREEEDQKNKNNLNDLGTRLHAEGKEKIKRNHYLAKQMEEIQLTDCTFQPQIHSKNHSLLSSFIAAENSTASASTYKPIHERLSELQKEKQRHLRELQHSLEKESSLLMTFQPQIDNKSRKLAEKKLIKQGYSYPLTLEESNVGEERGRETRRRSSSVGGERDEEEKNELLYITKSDVANRLLNEGRKLLRRKQELLFQKEQEISETLEKPLISTGSRRLIHKNDALR